MCGIVGYVGSKKALPLLVQGLKRLEYRGYDSAGLAYSKRGKLHAVKRIGKVASLEADLAIDLDVKSGIGHTRWATHGAVTEANAHPHLSPDGRIAIVHNGIIDNYTALKQELMADGVVFVSETDSEVVAHLASRYLDKDPVEAVIKTLSKLKGTYGLVFMFSEHPGLLIGARKGSPLVIGIGEKELFLASDPQAFLGHTREVVWLDDGDLALIRETEWEVRTFENKPNPKESSMLEYHADASELGDHPHYFLKELMEQPESIRNCLGGGGRLIPGFGTVKLGGLNMSASELASIKRVALIGMGSALFAAQAAAELIESMALLPARTLDASELRSSQPIFESDTLYLALSQSGETTDTIVAVQELQNRGFKVHGIINAVGSSLARLCNSGVYLHAGPEYSVATSKAFACQSLVGLLLALLLGRQRNIGPSKGQEIVAHLQNLPEYMKVALVKAQAMGQLAHTLSDSKHYLFLGRNSLLPYAREGALKLKELAYMPAEAYPTGGLKHGPLALVEAKVPSIVLVPGGATLDRDLANIQEIKARSGIVIALTTSSDPRIAAIADHTISLPEVPDYLTGLVMLPALQLFAYETAKVLGRDVDRPRNLAKSVTVD